MVFVIYIYGGKNELWMSVFWVSVTRFITLGLIFSFVYSTYFGVNFLLVFVLAYFVQIIFSSLVTRYIFS
ncbi:MAG: hypothetical protein H6767_04285 [Candidatus Peribacteria bacterium]|nr:MAG: hypothetical protein H6767_04285 [Candidatus Peribacteria bacterium]